MALDERSWHEAWDALADVVGAETAATLMGAWPRDPATRRDVAALDTKMDGVEQRLDARIDGVEAKIEATRQFLEEKIQHSEDRVAAVVRGELNSQAKSLMFGFVGLQATIGGFVIGLVRFAI